MILKSWLFWVLMYLTSAIIFAQTFKKANKNMENASLLTVLLELFTALFSLLFIPIFKFKISDNISVYGILLIVVIIYALVDRLNIEARYGLEPSTFSMLKQLSTAFIIILSIIFLQEKFVIKKIIGATLIIGANLFLSYNKKRFEFNKYFIMTVIANILFAIAMLININISQEFNIGLYTIITVLTPAIIIFLFGKYTLKDLKKEFSLYNKKLFLLSAFMWALMLISSVKAYEYGNIVLIASLLSLTTIINTIIEFIINRNTNQLIKKIIISSIIILGIILIKL